MENSSELGKFVKIQRRKARLTQIQLAVRAGVGLRLIRDIEQGKNNLRMQPVNKVLKLFGACLGPVDMPRE